MILWRVLTSAVAAVSCLSVTALQAQIRASEYASVVQTVDGTTMTVTYSRPQVRGRDSVFGGVVHWGEVWTPGANWSTTFTVDKDVTFAGHEVPAGSYSVWFEVQPGTWTVILDPNAKLYHTNPPDSSDAQIRFAVQPDAGGPTEMLTWAFTEVRASGAVLTFAWADATIPFPIRVQSSMTYTVDAAVAEPLLGEWQTVFGQDTVAFTLVYRDGHLVNEWHDDWAPDGGDPAAWEDWLVFLGEGMFIPVMVHNGEIYDVETDLVIEFTPLEGRATAFEMRATDDELIATGWRVR